MVVQVTPVDLENWAATCAVDGGHGQARVPVLLDVREPWELQTAAVPAAAGYEVLGIPMSTVPQRLAELDPARPVACLCHHGARSQRVAMFLQHNGFEHVANVAGGIDAWSRQRDPAVPLY